MNILITAGTTAYAHKLKRLLDFDASYIFADQEVPSIGKSILQIPKGDDPSFAHQLLTMALDLKLDLVFPLRRSEVLAFAEAKQLFAEYGIDVVIPSQNPSANLAPAGSPKGDMLIIHRGEVLGSAELPPQIAGVDAGVLTVPASAGSAYYIFTAD